MLTYFYLTVLPNDDKLASDPEITSFMRDSGISAIICDYEKCDYRTSSGNLGRTWHYGNGWIMDAWIIRYNLGRLTVKGKIGHSVEYKYVKNSFLKRLNYIGSDKRNKEEVSQSWR